VRRRGIVPSPSLGAATWQQLYLSCVRSFGNSEGCDIAAGKRSSGIALGWSGLGQCKHRKQSQPPLTFPFLFFTVLMKTNTRLNNGTLPDHCSFILVLTAVVYFFQVKKLLQHKLLCAFVRCRAPHQKTWLSTGTIFLWPISDPGLIHLDC
jgi:hypothetical protein